MVGLGFSASMITFSGLATFKYHNLANSTTHCESLVSLSTSGGHKNSVSSREIALSQNTVDGVSNSETRGLS